MQEELSNSRLLCQSMGRPALKPQPEYGQHLAQLRAKAGLSQQQLAVAVNVSQSNVAFWERSENPPKGESLPVLAKTLGVSIEILLNVKAKTDLNKHRGPQSKLDKVVSKVQALPRRQQQKVINFVELFLADYEQSQDKESIH